MLWLKHISAVPVAPFGFKNRFLEVLLFVLTQIFFHISSSWVEISQHTEFEPPRSPRSGRFKVGETQKQKTKNP